MRDFTAKISTRRGVEEQLVAADNLEEARNKVRHHGRILSIKAKSSWSITATKALSPAQRVTFLQKLSTMVGSKVQLETALKTLELAFTGPIRAASTSIIAKIGNGTDFADALKSMPKDFPEGTTALIDAGMRSGEFHTALSDAALFELEMQDIKKTSSGGLWEGIIYLVAGAALILATAYGFGPYFMSTSFMQTADIDIGWVVMLSDLLGGFIALISAIVIAVLILTKVIRPITPVFADKITLRLPFYRELALNRQHYIVFYTLSRLVDSGIRLDLAISISIQAAPKGEVKEDLQRALESLKKGNDNWALSMHNISDIDKAALTTSQNIKDVTRAIKSVSEGKKNDYARTLRATVPIVSGLGYFMMVSAGFLLFAFTTFPTLQMMKNMI